MQLEPKDLYEKLEFDKIVELTSKECLGSLGVAFMHQLSPSINMDEIDRKLKEVNELKISILKSDKFPIQNYFDIKEELKMLEIEDYVLPIEGMQKINTLLLLIGDIYRFFTSARKEVYPTLFQIIQNVHFDDNLAISIGKVIDQNGEIRSDASPELQKIRKQIFNRQRELDKEFRSIAGQMRQKGWLTDNEETFRNGRRVLSVPSEHKRKIRGIIHDESATGKTCYIEPEAVIEINNDIFELEHDELREIYRILKDLSAKLRPYTPQMRSYLDLAERFDVIQAKARVAVKMNANMPQLVDKACFGIFKGHHPLLLLKNKESGKKTVPFDMTLLRDNRILLISGPNAGGKSITMKAIGLLQLMTQCGMLIPVSEVSEVGIFHKIFADIGDQQSLEDELSTYSSRLNLAKKFVEKADERTLLLIDEFGAGTDPQIGGAIAESILKELNEKGCWGILNTHYSNLKVFAFNTKGLLNGCMLFDKDTLSATYELRIGRPGSSYAFEIAEKVGLPRKLLNYAKHKTGKNEKAVDELLVDLQKEKQEIEEHLDELKQKDRELQRLIKAYQEMHKEYEYKRKKLKLEIKEAELQSFARDGQDLERLIRDIREQQNLEKAKELATQRKQEKEKLMMEVEVLNNDIHHIPITHQDLKRGQLQVGDLVKAIKGGAIGRIERIEKSKAVVIMGSMRIEFKVSDLQHVPEQLEIIDRSRVQLDFVQQAAQFESRIDLRGMRMGEAMITLQNFLDRALMTSTRTVIVLHGKGDGILRRMVIQKLREYKDISNIHHAPEDEGGNGITIADLI
ncbi:MAG: endonuclease MutS2 [Saprospiraceae bacterium]